jgi:hypothetical protein
MNPSVCRSAENPALPCRFVDRCAEKDQVWMHRIGWRGRDCWRFVRELGRIGYDPPPGDLERQAMQEGGA